MSKAWEGGSTRAWRKLRHYVLMRDNWTCRLCGQAINPLIKHPHPQSASVHHIHGKARGDNPAYLQAAHRECNYRAGDPTAQADPLPLPRTQW